MNNILVENSGSYQAINHSIDIENTVLSSSNLMVNNFVFGSDDKIYKVSDKKILPIDIDTNLQSGSAIASAGDNYSPINVNAVSFSGDLSGDLNRVYVRNIANISSGVLGVANGGTGIVNPTNNSIN